MDKLFNEKMSFLDAQYAFFKAIDGKSKQEIERIKTQYDKVISVILNRELEMARQGWL